MTTTPKTPDRGAGHQRKKPAIEWPTVGLIFICYASFAVATTGVLPVWISVPLLAITIALHSSLQHEVLHGHPFRSRRLSELTVFPAIGLVIPYIRFKDTHLKHHFDPNLTDPYDDPETNYFDEAAFSRFPRWLQTILRTNNTLLGRMAVGPAIGLVVFWLADARAFFRGERRILLAWLHHAAGVVLVAIWLWTFGAISVWAYAIAAYLGLSLIRIRTFLEHRAHERASARSVIVEDRGPLALLFLNNNFHAVHHAHPSVPWYDLPDLYQSRRNEFLRRNGGYWYRNYRDVFRLHGFAAKDPVTHPIWNWYNRSRERGNRNAAE